MLKRKRYLLDPVLAEDMDIIASQYQDILKAYDKSTVLVTGATGLIGSQLVKTLVYGKRIYHLNLTVLAIVRNEEKARKVFGTDFDEIQFISKNLLHDELALSQNIDYIFHTASVTASAEMVSNPVETILLSVNGTRKILELAKEQHSKGVVYLSSMEVYGDVKYSYENVTEDILGKIDLQSIRSCYPESKRICECLCKSYAEEYGVSVRSARLAQCFGADLPQNENRVFAQFARSAMEQQDIVLHTTGESEGNYCYTRDAVAALLILGLKGESGEAYNVANMKSHMTIREMAEMVADKIADHKIKVKYDIPENNKYGYAPAVKLFLNAEKMEQLGWKASVNLEEAYRRTIRSLNYEWIN